MLVAHRGLRGTYENLLSMFKKAYEQLEFTACECDVHETKDHEWVVVHDATLQHHALEYAPEFAMSQEEYRRLTQTQVTQLTCAEIRSVPLKKNEDGSYEYVPLLAEVFAIVPPQKKLLIELKSTPVSELAFVALIKIIEKRAASAVLISFDWDVLCAAQRYLPSSDKIVLTTCRAPTLTSLEELQAFIMRVKQTFQQCHLGIGLEASSEYVQDEWYRLIHQHGLKIQVWYDHHGRAYTLAETSALITRLRALQVDYINTDYAEVASLISNDSFI